jgi:DNA-binding NarL/FixJ family response regulator
MRRRLKPDLVVLDMIMPQRHGITGGARVETTGPRDQVVFLMIRQEEEYAMAAFESGASGYVFKSRMHSVCLCDRSRTGGRTVRLPGPNSKTKLKGKCQAACCSASNGSRASSFMRLMSQARPSFDSVNMPYQFTSISYHFRPCRADCGAAW